MKKRMMLYFGSFNPIHRGHVALAEYVVAKGLCDEVALIISPQSPYKQTMALAPETDRFELAEMACKASRYPEVIRPSVVEFLLPKPSYTIDTLRYLEEVCGAQMEFSILMGADQLDRLDGWKEYERILEYPIYVYPRQGETMPERWEGRITMLTDAPLQNFSSTEVRSAIERGDDTSKMITEECADYIRKKGLWSISSQIVALNARLDADPDNVDFLLQRGQLHYRRNDWGAAINDFNRILKINPQHQEAHQLLDMVQEILSFRYKDIYNP